MSPLERLLKYAAVATVLGAAAAVPLLAVPDPSSRPLLSSTVHLSFMVAYAGGAAFAAHCLLGDHLFPTLGHWGRRLANSALAVVVVTGSTGLITLATAAALRYDPSLQFLQLLSALDIAWALTAIIIGGIRLRGWVLGGFAGTVLGTVCVWAIWRYLDAVGFTAAGGWQVDAAALWEYVLPYDTGAAIAAVAVLAAGARAQRTAQPSPKS